MKVPAESVGFSPPKDTAPLGSILKYVDVLVEEATTKSGFNVPDAPDTDN